MATALLKGLLLLFAACALPASAVAQDARRDIEAQYRA